MLVQYAYFIHITSRSSVVDYKTFLAITIKEREHKSSLAGV